MPDIGATLREARMRARIDISEIEAETKIRAKYLRALENEEWDLLPGPTFVRSFLRTYAEALGLDAKLLLEEYKLRHDRPSEQELLPIAPPSRRRPEPRRVPRGYAIGAVVVALLAALYLLGASTGDDGGDTATNRLAGQPPVTAPVVTTETTPRRRNRPRRSGASSGSGSKTVRLQILPSAPVYVCLTAAGNRRPVNGVIVQPGGTQPTFRSSRFELTLGNGSVDLRIDGRIREVPDVSEGIGYVITKGSRKVLPAGRRPDCA